MILTAKYSSGTWDLVGKRGKISEDCYLGWRLWNKVF